MPKALTLDGVPSLGAPRGTNCRCVLNRRTGRGVEVCQVPKSPKHRSGVAFTGPCDNPTPSKK